MRPLRVLSYTWCQSRGGLGEGKKFVSEILFKEKNVEHITIIFYSGSCGIQCLSVVTAISACDEITKGEVGFPIHHYSETLPSILLMKNTYHSLVQEEGHLMITR